MMITKSMDEDDLQGVCPHTIMALKCAPASTAHPETAPAARFPTKDLHAGGGCGAIRGGGAENFLPPAEPLFPFLSSDADATMKTGTLAAPRSATRRLT